MVVSWAALVAQPKPAETPQQQAARLKAEAEKKSADAAKALDERAKTLCALVQAQCGSASSGGVSGNYSAYQLEVKGEWTLAEIKLAFTKWKQIYVNAGTLESLNVHMMGPAAKWTGSRQGNSQANFIRLLQAGKTWSVNVHINHNG
ncbi:hypothetical protein GXW71_18185 [Roseomonas hellenica]|uniref:Uncharacterized protein n=1 Tax=Plastoroseomonas hellenica TaxID=2687306 RepID=A0ABS5F190_9PROT|nr:hypothetical protein [Plastoroseomonas hellenica]MBR0666296.1 hypothetical protein [Plastoroseomonas hellenica]